MANTFQPNTESILRSHVFPGLWLAINDLLPGMQVLAMLQKGLSAPKQPTVT
jgi:hypothetical protein